MTCIVGLIKDKELIIGGDSAGVGGLDIRIRGDVKVFETGPFLIGYTSSFRMGQLLRFKLNVPPQTNHQEDYEYMCTTFIDTVRYLLKEEGYTTINQNEEEIGVFIVGYKHKLYYIGGDLQVGEHSDKYDSVGCGSKYALGALDILTKDKKLSGREMVKKALETSAKFSAGVRGPFNIITIIKG